MGVGGLPPPGDLAYCGSCKHDRSGACLAQLGDKRDGSWDRRWKALATTRAPDSGACVTAEDPIVEDDPEIEDALAVVAPPPPEPSSVKDGGLLLGFAEDSSPVFMDPHVLRTHVSAVGAAGSGKTWMAKIIAEEALRAGIPVLAIDPQGDLVQMLEARPRGDVPAELVRAWEGLHERMEPRVFTPGSSHGVRLCLDPLRLPSPGDLSHIASPSLREEEEEGLLAAVAANIASLCVRGGGDGSQHAFLFQVLQHLPREERDGLGRVRPTARAGWSRRSATCSSRNGSGPPSCILA